MKAFDYTGWRFGRLTVVEPAPPLKGRTRWLCICDCGKTVIAKTEHLTAGRTKSCGCLRRETAKRRMAELNLERNFGL